MGILKKNKEVPEELPDLISDEIEKEGKGKEGAAKSAEGEKKSEGEKKETGATAGETKPAENPKPTENAKPEEKKAGGEAKPEVKPSTKPAEPATEKKEPAEQAQVKPESAKENPGESKSGVEDLKSTLEADKSFFAELEDEISKDMEVEDDSFEDLLESKFSSENILDQMKNYWGGKREISSVDLAIGKLKPKILKQVTALKNLEKEWQAIYFKLIEKEEDIREQESVLKEDLGEFTDLCKQKKELKKKHENSNIAKNKNEGDDLTDNEKGQSKESSEGEEAK